MPESSGLLPLASVAIRDVCWSESLTARCLASGVEYFDASSAHRAPAHECRCGIYAWYQPDDLNMMPGGVFGVIEASGLIFMGTQGFRAEHATIVAVVAYRRRIRNACAHAGIAVYGRRSHLINDYPPEDVSALIDSELVE
ncbi:MAG TPA: hypothetical protein VN636_12360 [Acidimicrobiia bacterium]|nr:hypothetical protein [Acidimicrobiia bacterium]